MQEGGYRLIQKLTEGNSEVPLVSIITVTFNAERHLAQSLDSSLAQTFSRIELIVVDGGSSDNTLDIIRQRESKIAYWRSEPDHGIYDAMNKGLQWAKGHFVIFKNADDWFLPDAIEKFAFCLNQTHGDVFCGHSLSVVQEEPLVTAPFYTNISRIGLVPGIDHRSCFIRREVHLKSPFQLQYRLAADLDAFWRLKHMGARFIQMDHFVSYKRFGGASDGNHILKECFLVNRRQAGLWFALKAWVQFQIKFFIWKWGNALLKFFLGKERYNRFKSRKLK